MMDPNLQRLQELQVLDSRVAGFERKLEAIPGRIQAIRDGLQQAKGAVDAIRTRLDGARKDMRTKEKELEYQGAQRKKLEAKLYEVKTNKEYSAALAEIEGAKVEKNRLEEEILGLMELQERLGREVVEGDARHPPPEAAPPWRRGRGSRKPRPPRSCGRSRWTSRPRGASGRASPARCLGTC
jgi:predicted  nucleic acid-binding Zn-ribbon protein